MTPDREDLARLLAVHEIRTLKARYFRTLDLKDWEGFQGVFSLQARMPVAELRGHGHYDEEYIVHDGEWRIHRMRLSGLRVETTVPHA